MKLILIAVLLFCLSSCTDKEEKLKIIDDIILGQTRDDYQKQLTELKIPHREFFTQWLLLKPDDKQDNKIDFYYTDKFNFSEFIDKQNSIEHFGAFFPEFVENRLTSLIILLGHTSEPEVIGDTAEKGKLLQLRQDVANDIIQKIKLLYVLKYGQPLQMVDTTIYKDFYHLFKNSVQKKSMECYDCFDYRWETEYYDITFFGLNLNAYYIPGKGYSQSTNWLYSNLTDGALEGNQRPCYSVPFIKYTLNNKGLEKLNLKLKL